LYFICIFLLLLPTWRIKLMMVNWWLENLLQRYVPRKHSK